MAWIKRNLWFTVGSVVALLLLGAALFYVYQSMNRNQAAFDKLNEIHGTLQQITSEKLSPGNDKINNTQAAKEQEKQLREWISQTGNYFKPIDAIPSNDSVNSELFATALRNTIAQLQHESSAANVTLPPQYGFSFEAERAQMKFASDGLPALALQLGEVKTISEILFASRVNGIDAIQRLRVSTDDANASQGDYFDGAAVTNEMVAVTPYLVTFRSFSSEIAQVLAQFAASSHGFVVKILTVQPAGAAPVGPPNAGESAPQAAPSMTAPASTTGRSGLQTVLKEQLLRVTIEVDIVKLQPKS